MTIALETPTLTIRAATEADIPQIVKMGLRFATAEYAISLPADPDRIAALAQNLMGVGVRVKRRRSGRHDRDDGL